MKRIHLISGPRNISTALMYSFGNRSDCRVVDEPFYAYYLKRHPDIVHPGMDEVLRSQDCDFDTILKNEVFCEIDKDVYFIKNMAHHLDGSDWKFLKDLNNVFLIRDPRQLIASFSRVIKNPTILDIALKLEFEILEFCIENEAKYVVVDSNDILVNPESGLKKLCVELDIPFSNKMISWESGKRVEDGVWSKYWYASVHKSTGFKPQSSSTYEVPEHLGPLLEEAQYYYDKIQSKKTKTKQLIMLQKFDPRNEQLMIYVGNEILPREQAKISVFDSVVQGGDAVWEGLRLYKNGVFMLDRHLDRLFGSAKAMHFSEIPTRAAIKKALKETLEANNMSDEVHIRLTLTRGEKITSGMDPRLNTKGCNLIILPEYKPPVYDNQSGIKIMTSTIRRNSPNHLDSKIHHNNLINNILAKIQANYAGADAALMLDVHGFASELNGTNIFMIKKGKIYTPFADACLPGITRGLVIEIANELGIDCIEKNISLVELYTADHVFCTGTMGEITPIIEIDGRLIEEQESGDILTRIKHSFEMKIPTHSVKVEDL